MKKLIWIFLGLTFHSNCQTPGDGLKDFDGNHYNSVVIGIQVWMKENLNVSHYRNGDVIPQVTDPTQWKNLTTGAWCYYNNDPGYGSIYGKLYNWYAVNDYRGIAPNGFHIPTDAEWTILTNFLGEELVAGGKMKEKGTVLWLYPNTGNSNVSGFTGLPGGFRSLTGSFGFIGKNGSWWSSSNHNPPNTWFRSLNFDVENIERTSFSKILGYSVRCIKD